MAKLQMGSGIGAVVGPDTSDPNDRGSARDVLGPDTPAGQAFLVAVLGLALLMITVARGERGLVAKFGRVLETVVVIGAAAWVANYAARTYALLHPDGPLADGFRFDA